MDIKLIKWSVLDIWHLEEIQYVVVALVKLQIPHNG